MPRPYGGSGSPTESWTPRTLRLTQDAGRRTPAEPYAAAWPICCGTLAPGKGPPGPPAALRGLSLSSTLDHDPLSELISACSRTASRTLTPGGPSEPCVPGSPPGRRCAWLLWPRSRRPPGPSRRPRVSRWCCAKSPGAGESYPWISSSSSRSRRPRSGSRPCRGLAPRRVRCGHAALQPPAQTGLAGGQPPPPGGPAAGPDSPNVAVGPAHTLLEALLPPDWGAQQVYDHHEVLMMHGQQCCCFRGPACQRCAVLDLCPTGQGRVPSSRV